jgi:hypothetical protein
MKKLIVLLLALAMVGGVFAQTPSLSANATLKFGVDLDKMQLGFSNSYSAAVTIPFAVANASKKGDSGWWGEIAVSNVTFELSDDPVAGTGVLTFTDTDADGNPATLSAKITNGTWALSVYSKPSLDFDVALSLDDSTSTVKGAFDADSAGTKLSYSAGPLSAGVIATSNGDWTTNTKNEFALGAYADYKLNDNLSFSSKFGYDAFDASKQMAAAGKVSAAFGALKASVAGDATLDTFAYDVRGDVSYALMEGAVTPAVAVYYDQKDLDARVAADYAKDAVEAGISFTDNNIFKKDTQSYAMKLYAGYTLKADEKTSVYFRVNYKDDLAGTRTLGPYVKLTNTSIANTTLTVTWCSLADLAAGTTDGADLLAKQKGALVFAAKVSL